MFYYIRHTTRTGNPTDPFLYYRESGRPKPAQFILQGDANKRKEKLEKANPGMEYEVTKEAPSES